MSTSYAQPISFKVMYPAGLLPLSEGRNGYVNTSGLSLKLDDKNVIVRPITSKGLAASSCRISVPADRATLLALADQIREIAMGV